MSPAAEEPLPFEGFEAKSRAEQDRQLLDEGFMLLKKGTGSKRKPDPVTGGLTWTSYPTIEAKYQERRTWYVLEKTFRDVAHRDRRFAELLKLDKRIERLF